jgi:hypothetical protein
MAGSQPLQFNVLYSCGSDAPKIKVLSCAGPGDNAVCDVQSYTRAEPGPRSQSTRKALLLSLEHCRAEA